jgi:hypothetical protein
VKNFKAILTLTATLLFGGFCYASPMAHNSIAPPLRISATASTSSVVVLTIPLGDQAVCAAGIQMPDCALDPYEPQYWMEIVEVNGVVVSEKIIAGTPANQ